MQILKHFIEHKGSYTNHVDSHGGRGGQWNVHFTNKAYLVKLSTKGGGVKKVQKMVHLVCVRPLGRMCRTLSFSLWIKQCNFPKFNFFQSIATVSMHRYMASWCILNKKVATSDTNWQLVQGFYFVGFN